MTLTERQQACDLWCIDNPDEAPFCAPFTIDEVTESRARIALKRKGTSFYANTVRAELLRDVDNLDNRCRTAESDCRAAKTLLREQREYDGLVAVLIVMAFAAGILFLAAVQHWCGR